MDMALVETREERTKRPIEEMKEEEKEFLKDLYVFMKKRDTPIERIPNLGFKQIDLFVMFETVRDLGGYHQVTAQQLWKQVYNMLGGNPRSTSAATCTRRHYEKLLLPYECHVKGISLNKLPLHQPKHLHFANFNKDNDDGQRPAKRQLLSIPLPQNLHPPQSDQSGSTFQLPLQYTHYYHPSHMVLPPQLPVTSTVLTQRSPPPPQFPFNPRCLNPESVNEPLEHLRFLAERYKTSSGLAEPLNLSVKASRQETKSNPASSFSPPSSSKNPKFLNKPSPLYTPRCPQVVRDERRETPDVEAGLGDTPAHPGKAREAYVIEVKAITASRSPACDSALKRRADEGQIDLTMEQNDEREGSPEARGINLSQILPSIPRGNGGEMEIEMPLSVFQNWLRQYRSSAMMAGGKQLPTLPILEEQSGQTNCSNTDVLPTNLTFQMSPQNWSSDAQDLRIRPRNLPSPTTTTRATGNHHNHMSPNSFANYKVLPSGGILKNAASRDVFPFDRQGVFKPYTSKPTNCWDSYEKETQAPPIQVNVDSNPLSVLQNFAAAESYNEDLIQAGKERSEMFPSTVLMMNSGSTPLLHLTTEEVLKLKKIISSSS
ncbi:AT-rich interaction domain 6 [Pagrus major]|uniref:AT-rich interaction domain 6 n=1 Tax=Pagrus major TaxID=143350 RepID=UPI003CC8D807